MLKTRLLTTLLLFTPMVSAVAGNPPLFRKSYTPSSSSSSLSAIPVILPENALFVTSILPAGDSDDIPLIYDDCRLMNFNDLPKEYDLWNEMFVNPYGVRLAEMKDTIKIDMRGFLSPASKYVTSRFGFRKGRFHYGIDIKVHKGDTVFCAFDGQVRLTKYERKGYGHYVVVRHQNGLETLYAHFDKTFVTPGQTVVAGEALGMGGNTGRSTGYHLHFETRYLGNAINPDDLYDFTTHRVKSEVFWLTATNFGYVHEVEKVRFWTVSQGDTLGKIASKTGVSISRLCTLNNIKKTGILRIGQKIRYT